MNNESIFDKEFLFAILDYINNNRGQLPDAETPGFEEYDDDEIVKSINYLSKDLQILTLHSTPIYEDHDNSGNWENQTCLFGPVTSHHQDWKNSNQNYKKI